MSLTVGRRIGPYEVVGSLGAGGMGEVYRARDTRLKREVALKILPDSFAAQPERLARFQREAEVLAALNHPKIAAIYGLEEQDGSRALVMELVEGPTLADRVARGPIPVDEALPIAQQIAEALEAAHEQGIVHRDLKPANIKLRPDGTVKVLDFGLAKALDSAPVPVDVTQSPTITSPAVMSAAGLILGTAAYMSPEQARGRAVDRRSDIWAYGCVLYEMLTGKRAFGGDDVSVVLARVLEREPDFSALPARTPSSVVRLLRRALAKDRQMRLPDIGMARLELTEWLSGHQEEIPARIAKPARRETVAWGVAIAALVAVLFLTFRTATAPSRVQFAVTPPDNGIFSDDGQSSRVVSAQFAISPDGRQLTFVATTGDGRSRLWVRSIDSAQPRVLAGTEGAAHPFWSPDATRIAFAVYTGTTDLYVKPANGGREELLVKTGATGAFPTSWSLDGRLLVYAAASSKTSYDLWTLALDGDRTPRPLLQSGFVETQGQLSPDGRWIAYTTDETGTREVWVQSVPTSGAKWQISTEGGSEPRWRGDGGELYYIAGNGTLMAVATNTTLATFVPGIRQPLFQTRRPSSSPLHTNYTPAADGQRFLINTVAGDAPAPTPITVILNWTEALGR